MNISILEYGVYGFIAYFTFAMLVASIQKEIPGGKVTSLARSIFMVPGIICSGILTWSGVNITLQNGTVSNIIKNLNDTSTWSETATTTQTIVLVNPIWITVHFMLMVIMIIYVIVQILTMLTLRTAKVTDA